MPDATSRQLAELLQRWSQLRDRGEDVPVEEICRAHPELLDELKQRIQGQETITSQSRPQAPELVVGTSQKYSREVEDLLRRRLRVVGLMTALGTAAFWLLNYFSPDQIAGQRTETVVLALVVLGQTLLTGLVWSKRSFSLAELRWGEAAILLLTSSFVVWNEYTRLSHPHILRYAVHDDGTLDRGGVSLIAYSMAIPWFALMMTYGTLVPTSWRRCAIFVALMLAAPFGTAIAVGMSDPRLAPVYHGSLLVEIGIWLGIGALLSVYGSHKVSALRQEAFTARKLGQYVLRQRLGAGGMGEVYLAEHSFLRRPCAIKLIRPDQAGDPRSLARFEREVRAMARLTHWNTAEIYDYGHTDDGTFYYVMEYLPGLSLEEMVTKDGPLPPARVVHLLRQICGGLAEAHGVGMVHRDIKPSNIIVCERGGLLDVVKVLDFGLVLLGTDDPELSKITREGTVIGTPLFMSPEQAAGKPHLDSRSDIYSLGAVGYFCLKGEPVFVRETTMQVLAAHISEPIVPLRASRPDIPEDLEAAILRCLEKAPEKRFQDVRSLDKALAHCQCAGAWTQANAADWWRARPAPNAAAEPAAMPETLVRT